MTPIEKLARAITAAERDQHGGKVMIDIETAKALLPDYGTAKANPMAFYDFKPADGSARASHFLFRRSGNALGRLDFFRVRPIALHFGETRMWPGETKWYIEGENMALNAIGMFALDCLIGVPERVKL